MPIPNPKANEKQDDYVSRCIAAISGEYEEPGQAAAVCHSTWRDKKNMAASDTYELDVEIFAVGTWNGIPFDKADLRMMAANFNALAAVHKVPLKFGHNDEQPMTDGYPALGWVDKVWVAGDVLMAHFTDIPQVVYNAMSKKLYKHVSIELDMGVEHKGNYYPLVLSGVALLGADIPAVNTIKDLQTYMGRDALRFTKRVAFTAITEKPGGNNMATVEELQAENARLQAVNTQQASQIATFTTKQTELEGKVTALEADKQRHEAETKKANFNAKKTALTGDLDTLVKANVITPGQREKYLSGIKEDDNSTLDKLEFAVSVLKEDAKVPVTIKDNGTASQHSSDESGMSVNDVVISRTKKFMRDNNVKSFVIAKNEVLAMDDDLARQYRDANDSDAG